MVLLEAVMAAAVWTAVSELPKGQSATESYPGEIWFCRVYRAGEPWRYVSNLLYFPLNNGERTYPKDLEDQFKRFMKAKDSSLRDGDDWHCGGPWDIGTQTPEGAGVWLKRTWLGDSSILVNFKPGPGGSIKPPQPNARSTYVAPSITVVQGPKAKTAAELEAEQLKYKRQQAAEAAKLAAATAKSNAETQQKIDEAIAKLKKRGAAQ